jgi:TIR domain
MAIALPQEVFLSHSSLDRQFADDVTMMLRRHGVPVFYSQTNILGAQQWQDEIGDALDRCDWFAVILSPQSVNSMWVKRELSYVLTDNRLDDRVIPILYQPVNYRPLHWTLRTLQIVDFTGTFDVGCASLLRTWGLPYRPQP